MPRPRKQRTIGADIGCRYYKPQGIPLRDLDEVLLTLDRLEALRLADVVGLDQGVAAERMGISRPTFSRLLAEARRVVAGALVGGAAIRIEGGPVAVGRPGPCPRRGARPTGCRRTGGTEDIRTDEGEET